MLRARLKDLEIRQGLYFRGSQPFSGLAYRISDAGVIQGLMVIKDGAFEADSDDLLPLFEGGLRVDQRFLVIDEDYGPLLYRGAPFSGLAYGFDASGACLSETDYEDGVASGRQHRTWYPDGAPESAANAEGGFAWFPDGRIRAAKGPEGTLLNLILDDEGALRGIFCRDSSLLRPESLAGFSVLSTFSLLGSGLDTSILVQLMQWLDFSDVRNLTIKSTSLAAEDLDELAMLPSLETVSLAKNPRLSREDARRLRRARPALTVLFDQERIALEPSEETTFEG